MKAQSSSYECTADTSWVSRLSCADGAGVAEAGTDVAKAETDVVADEVVSLRRRISVQWPG